VAHSESEFLIFGTQEIMATRGVFQLRKLTLNYCEVGGSSRAMREYIGDGHLVAWATARPHVQIEVKRRQNRHPYVHADYLTSTKKNIHQVSVKSVDSWRDVEFVLDKLANRSGRKVKKFLKPIITQTPSIQGIWTPFLNLQTEPNFSVKFIDTPEKPAAASESA